MASRVSGSLSTTFVVPAAPPPPGEVSNFVNPYSQGPIFYGVCGALLVVMLFLLAIRTYTKIYIVQEGSWDDCKVYSL